MWSDPENIESGAWAISPRGAGYLFGHKIAAEVSGKPPCSHDRRRRSWRGPFEGAIAH